MLTIWLVVAVRNAWLCDDAYITQMLPKNRITDLTAA